jgi:hypothetical protein
MESQEGERGELIVPYVTVARRYFLPQWVAFDEQDRLLVNSVNQAEAYIVSMQMYLKTLHAAVSLAPYTVADEAYRMKRYGMLGQLVNQGRALARFETSEIIAIIRRRAGAKENQVEPEPAHFDDQIWKSNRIDFDVIPAGRSFPPVCRFSSQANR